MKTFRTSIILMSLLVGFSVYGQEDKILSLIDSACNYEESGDFIKSVQVWDLYLEEVQLTEGNNCLHYFMGQVYKAGVLIKLEKYHEAEDVLLSAKVPDNEGNLRLTLTYLKNLGKCGYNLGRLREAYVVYKKAYDILLKKKKFFVEENGSDYHWCWTDEMCSIALEIARLYKLNGEYANAEMTIREAFGKMRKDSKRCFEYNGDGLYYLCLNELMEIYNETLSIAINNNDPNYALAIYDLAINVAQIYAELITTIKWEGVDFVIRSLLNSDKQKAKIYIDEYICLSHLALENWYTEGMFENRESYLISKQFEYVKFGHTCQDGNDYEMAEEYYRKAKLFLEENNLKKTEDYLNVLDDISYLLELKQQSK